MLYDSVLLVNPSYKNTHFSEPQLHSGLGYIAQSIEDHGIKCEVLDMSVGYDDARLMNVIERFKPALVGFTLMTYRYKDNYARINAVKKKFPGIKVVAGGPHVSLLRQRVLKECGGIDMGVVLEGEEAIVEVCRGEKALKDIKGLVFRDGADVVFNGEREFCTQLDDFSFPRYSKFELDKYPRPNALAKLREIPIVTSRGCPAQCIFCPVKTSIGQKFRFRSAGNILAELRYWYEKCYRTFWIADDNFTLLKERVLELCALIKASGMNELVLGCGNGIRADRVDREILTAMREAGFATILFGIEGGNDRILKILKKGETIEVIENSIRIAFECGFSVMASFLLGSPGETKSDIEDSFRLASKYPFSEVRFYHPIPYPGTELYDWIEKNGYFIYQPEEYLNEASSLKNRPVYRTPELSESDRQEIFRRAVRLSNEIRINNYSIKLRALGLPGPAAKLLARIYNIRALNGFINKSVLLRKIKDGFN